MSMKMFLNISLSKQLETSEVSFVQRERKFRPSICPSKFSELGKGTFLFFPNALYVFRELFVLVPSTLWGVISSFGQYNVHNLTFMLLSNQIHCWSLLSIEKQFFSGGPQYGTEVQEKPNLTSFTIHTLWQVLKFLVFNCIGFHTPMNCLQYNQASWRPILGSIIISAPLLKF